MSGDQHKGNKPRKWFNFDFRRTFGAVFGAAHVVVPAAVSVAALIAPRPADAGILYSYKRRSANDRLANIPCFLITNSNGRPYIHNGEDGQQVIMFLDYKDAEAMANEMMIGSGYQDVRIMAISMQKGFKKVRSARMKLKPPATVEIKPGQDMFTEFRKRVGYQKTVWFKFYASSAMSKIALTLPQACDSALDTAPVFFIEGLEIKKSGKRMMPYFFSYNDCLKRYEEAREAWLQTRENDPEFLAQLDRQKSNRKNVDVKPGDKIWPLEPEVKVDSVLNILAAIKDIEEDNYHMGLVPDSEQLQWMRSQMREGTKPAVIMEEP